jgi:hypothetical protein
LWTWDEVAYMIRLALPKTDGRVEIRGRGILGDARQAGKDSSLGQK